MFRRSGFHILLAVQMLLLQSCAFMFGTKEDETVEEIFEEGAIDPNLVPDAVGYVPILPVWNFFSNPIDVYVGYDEMVYVIDDNGVNVLDQKGQLHRTIRIPGAKEIIQDRRIHTYVIGRAKVKVSGQEYDLPAVYHLINAASASEPVIVDTLIHPFADVSRRNISFRNEDLQVEFTGLATRHDNVLYVSRKGPKNDPASTARPDNTVLFFSPEGENIGYALGLNSTTPTLKSALDISSIASFATPPQRVFGVSESNDFLLAQADQTRNIEFRVLWIKENADPDQGVSYTENTAMLNRDTSKAERFLYDSYRFKNPQDVYAATDAAGFIFVVDAALDSLYQFTSQGFEGVNPPANTKIRKNIRVSFGGRGNGPFQFNQPSGVCYFNRTVYVADKGNNRVMRYKLSTDIE
ncbi:MAG: hypothetical protein ACXWDO_01040 [Bacteroidia bacterium]